MSPSGPLPGPLKPFPSIAPTIRQRSGSSGARQSKSPDLVSQFEDVVHSAANDTTSAYHDLSSAVGDRPFGTQKLPERTQVRRYMLVRDDPNAWLALLQQHGQKACIEYAQRGERLMKKYPDEAAYLHPAPVKL